jgi:IS6 family transposase
VWVPNTGLLRWPIVCSGGEGVEMKRRRHPVAAVPESSAFAGLRFPPEVILLSVRWYLRFGLSYRDLEELLAERGIEVDHVTLYRWVQRFTPLLIDAARPCRHAVGSRWFVDETYVKVAGTWRYVYRAVDQHGQVIDVYVSPRRDITSARMFFTTALTAHGEPDDVVTDLAPALGHVINNLLPAAFHDTGQYANNRIESWPAQGAAASNARPEDRPNRGDHHRGTRLHAEPAPWPLRTRTTRHPTSTGGSSVR